MHASLLGRLRKALGRSSAKLGQSKPIFLPVLTFWVTLAALNVLLFLPTYVMGLQQIAESTGPPSGTGLAWFEMAKFKLGNNGLLGINAEVLIIGAVLAHFAVMRRRTGKIIALLLYVITFAFYLYQGFIQSIYARPTNFFADYYLARDGMPFLVSHLNLPLPLYAAAAGVAVAMMWGLARLFGALSAASGSNMLGPVSRVAVAVLAGAVMVSSLLAQPVSAEVPSLTSSATMEISRSVQRSVSLRSDMRAFATEAAQSPAAVAPIRLKQKPDIYLVFVESYGSVLLRRPDFADAYEQLAIELESALRDNGWHVASGMSQSPTWGGGSWMAYTSALFGLRIDTHPQYLELLETYGQTNNPYPSLPRYLKSQGYKTLWLSPIAKELSDEKWEQYRRFYSIDTWLRHRDFEYVGNEYGWGPAPPDQYVLEFARNEYVNTAEQPVFTMFVTQNSHFPFHAPELADDWHTLNRQDEATPDRAEESDHQKLRASYLNAIEYELRMLSRFILESQDNAIFVLIGDHQPPRVSRRDDSFDTPVHIITRDPGVIQGLSERGFVDGLLPEVDSTSMSHETLYPLLLDMLQDLSVR